MMTKREAIAAVIIAAVLLAVALVSQSDAAIKGVPVNGGTYRTNTAAQWQLYKYRAVDLPKRYPYKYAPWRSFLLIDEYTKVTADSSHNILVIDPELYDTIKPEADTNKDKAKRILARYKVKGKGKTAYKKIGRYVRAGSYKKGIKSAAGFFDHHGGDCAAHAAAVYVLCQVQGIPVRYCIGSMDGGCHAWNRVKLGRVWYWADETMGMWLSRKLWEGYKQPMEMW